MHIVVFCCTHCVRTPGVIRWAFTLARYQCSLLAEESAMPVVPVKNSFKGSFVITHVDISHALPERLNLGQLKK